MCPAWTSTSTERLNALKKQSKNDTDLEERGRFSLVLFLPAKGSPESNKPKSGLDARAEITPVLGLYGTPPRPSQHRTQTLGLATTPQPGHPTRVPDRHFFFQTPVSLSTRHTDPMHPVPFHQPRSHSSDPEQGTDRQRSPTRTKPRSHNAFLQPRLAQGI